MDYNDYLASTIDKHADLINEYRLGDLATALYNTPGIVQYGYADVLHDIVNLMIEEDPEKVFSKGLPFMFKNIDCPNHVKMDLRGISGTCGITQSKLRNGITIYCDEIPFGFLTNTLVNGVIRIVGAKTLMPWGITLKKESHVDIYLPKSLTSLSVLILPWQAHIKVHYEGTCEELDNIITDKEDLKKYLIGDIICSNGIWEAQ